MYGKPQTEESNAKRSKALKGKLHSEERKLSTREKKKLLPKREVSQETRDKISKHHFISECPHCHKTGNNLIMQRHHFDRCKSKEKNLSYPSENLELSDEFFEELL